MQITDLPTPQVLIDRRRLTANIERMQTAATRGGMTLRPHTKTHKSPRVAKWQVDAGASGIACAKIGEAEVFADAGFTDIRLPYPINPSNSDRLLALMERAQISIVVDHAAVATEWSEAMLAAGKQLDVLVKVDVGYHRCGIDPALATAVPFLTQVAALPGLRLRGLLSHAGQSCDVTSAAELAAVAKDEAELLRTLAAEARRAGVAVDEISVGSTATAMLSATEPDITELRPGNYVYYDRSQVAIGSASLEDCALSVMATVVSKPADNRIVLDCGSKTLTSDTGRGMVRPKGYGAVFAGLDALAPDDSLLIARLSEEHGVVEVQTGATRLEPGDRVRVLPNHSCVVSNLVDAVRLVEGSTVVDTLPVAARGKIS
ncbi:MAG: alanine racemase [Vicinamibacterales bacterium]|jgi:D-serine deaminase-like pyridoxal phosphate-dependent protein|nr:alanine racemase [Vicinamibacterales bacterium]MDP6610013.1 alanine racemase [Vicinamibacterales bacterium]|tara:strand:+ start:6030 stop:7154 length:1125 start_codon:yes stop_codon:yes gene_type:complete